LIKDISYVWNIFNFVLVILNNDSQKRETITKNIVLKPGNYITIFYLYSYLNNFNISNENVYF